MRAVKVTLTDALHRYIANQAGEGTRFATPEEYIADLIRQDQARAAERVLDQLLMESLATKASPLAPTWKRDAMREAKAKVRARALKRQRAGANGNGRRNP